MNFLWLTGLALICGGALIWQAFNRLAALDSRCDRAFADIDVQLKHRHGLLPNLLETVQAFANQELTILDKVTASRAAALGAKTPQAQMVAELDLSTGLAQLLTAVEILPAIAILGAFHRLAPGNRRHRKQNFGVAPLPQRGGR